MQHLQQDSNGSMFRCCARLILFRPQYYDLKLLLFCLARREVAQYGDYKDLRVDVIVN